MPNTCSSCGAENAAEARFCNQCGTELAAPVAAGAERKQITVFFADLSGYTAMSERLDPEEVQEIMNTVFSHAARLVEKYGGRIDKFQGDAVMAVFGDPVSHEDDAERAVRAVLELHAAVDDFSPVVEQRLGQSVRMHTGINTGLVVTSGPEFDNAVGDAINVASRLEDLSEPGEILLGPETAHMVEGRFDTVDHGLHELKGKAGAVPVTKVVGYATARAEPSRRQARFVGRHEELGVLLGAVERMRDGEASVIAVEAEAGAGKTRLIEEFRDRLPEPVQWLEGRAYAYGENIPYSPIIDLLSRSIGITEEDGPQAVESKLRATVADLVDDVETTYEPLARLFGVDSAEVGSLDRETYQSRLLGAVRMMADALARRAPTVLALQDLHWADDSTVRLIRELIGTIEVPLVVVVNYRPGFTLDFGGARELRLRELSPRQVGELVESLLDGQPAPDELTEFIVARTDGNPFFAEEIVNSLMETGTLVSDGGIWRVSGELGDVDLPTTIRGVIAARIDRLDEGRRRVLREASVVGREFLYDVVKRVTTVTDELDPSLADLQAADLIREKAVDPDLEYLFKHALTQDVAYDGLLKSERQMLHARAAAAIEEQFEGREVEVAETLAFHWEQSGVTDKAVEHLRAAGYKAMERFALKEARAHYESAYDLLTAEAPSDERDKAIVGLLLDWTYLAYYEARLHFLRNRLLEHQDLVERVGTPEQQGLWTAWLGHAYMAADGEMVKAVETLDEAIGVGRQTNSLKVVGYAQCWRAYALWWTGRFEDSIAAGEEAYRIGKELLEDPYVWLKASLGLGLAWGMAGNLDEATRLADELLAYGATSGSSRATAMGYIIKVNLIYLFDPELESSYYEALERSANDPIYEHAVFPPHGFSLALTGRTQEGRRFVDDQYKRYHQEAHVHMLGGWFELVFALIEASEGNPAGGMTRLERMIDLSKERGEMLYVDFSELLLAFLAAEIAMADGGIADILRNPAFALRRGISIRKEARRRLESVSAGLEENGLGGTRALLDFTHARFLWHEGDREGAIGKLGSAIEAASVAGESPWRREATALLAEWEGETP